jgi:hypothetical protein
MMPPPGSMVEKEQSVTGNGLAGTNDTVSRRRDGTLFAEGGMDSRLSLS